MIIKFNTLADFSGRSKCLTHPSSAKDNMLYKRSRYDLIRLKAENLTLHETLKKLWLETYSYYREHTWWFDGEHGESGWTVLKWRLNCWMEFWIVGLRAVFKSGSRFHQIILTWSHLNPWSHLTPGHGASGSREAAGPLELLSHLDLMWSIDSLVLWIDLAP